MGSGRDVGQIRRGWRLSSLLFLLSCLLSFLVLSFRHSGWSPLFSTSENGVLDGDRFEVVIGDVYDERSSSPEVIYSGKGARVDSSDLKICVIVQEGEVCVSLSELGKGTSFLELVL